MMKAENICGMVLLCKFWKNTALALYDVRLSHFLW